MIVLIDNVTNSMSISFSLQPCQQCILWFWIFFLISKCSENLLIVHGCYDTCLWFWIFTDFCKYAKWYLQVNLICICLVVKDELFSSKRTHLNFVLMNCWFKFCAHSSTEIFISYTLNFKYIRQKYFSTFFSNSFLKEEK